MAEESDRDIREEVGISLFWREMIGDYEYGRFNPADMLRWYDALKLRGPDEIRTLVDERYTSRPVSTVQGIVAGAPHPPTWLVREWLAHFEDKVTTGGYWMAAAGFILLCLIAAPVLNGMTRLTPLSTFIKHPPFGGPQVYQPQNQQSANSLAATVTAPPATLSTGQTGAASQGLAGAATGASPPGGTTGPSSGGLSAGATSPAPAVGSNQP